MPQITELVVCDDERFARLALLCLADIPAGERNECVRELYRSDQDRAWFDRAKRNEIGTHVAHALADALGPDRVPAHWLELHRDCEDRIRTYLGELDRVAGALDARGIRLVALKNAGIARGIHPCPGCCPMGDIDVLVRRDQFREAHRLLLELGFQVRFRSPLEQSTDLDEGELDGGMEYLKPGVDGDGLWWELQWRPVSGRWIRPDQEPDSSDLVERSLPIEGTRARLLAPVDNLLQVALHLAKHSYVRAPGLRLHTDVDRVVRRQPIDWELFLQRVESSGVRTPVYFALAIPAELLGTPVPAEVLARLRPSRFKHDLILRQLVKAGLFEPHEKKFTNLAYLLFNAGLYDDARGLWRAVFPDREWMRQRYGVRSDLALPVYHLKRMFHLARRRTL